MKRMIIIIRKIFARKNLKKRDIDGESKKRHLIEMEAEAEQDKLLTYIEKKKEEFVKEQATRYEEKLKELSKVELRVIAHACLSEYALFMRQLGQHMYSGNIYTSKRVLGKMIEDLSDSIHSLPREVFSPSMEKAVSVELLFFLEFIYVYEDIIPDWISSSFMFLKAAFPEGFVFVPEVPEIEHISEKEGE